MTKIKTRLILKADADLQTMKKTCANVQSFKKIGINLYEELCL